MDTAEVPASVRTILKNCNVSVDEFNRELAAQTARGDTSVVRFSVNAKLKPTLFDADYRAADAIPDDGRFGNRGTPDDTGRRGDRGTPDDVGGEDLSNRAPRHDAGENESLEDKTAEHREFSEALDLLGDLTVEQIREVRGFMQKFMELKSQRYGVAESGSNVVAQDAARVFRNCKIPAEAQSRKVSGVQFAVGNGLFGGVYR